MSGKQKRIHRCALCGHRFSGEGMQAHRWSKSGQWACRVNSIVLPARRSAIAASSSAGGER